MGLLTNKQIDECEILKLRIPHTVCVFESTFLWLLIFLWQVTEKNQSRQIKSLINIITWASNSAFIKGQYQVLWTMAQKSLGFYFSNCLKGSPEVSGIPCASGLTNQNMRAGSSVVRRVSLFGLNTVQDGVWQVMRNNHYTHLAENENDHSAWGQVHYALCKEVFWKNIMT